MNAYPVLETERLLLRQMTKKDVDFLFQLYSSREVLRYFGMSPIASKEAAEGMVENYEKQLESGGPMRWGIVDKETGNLIGTCGFHGIAKSYKRCEIGYDLRPEFWGRGIMAEALRPMLSYLFNERDMNRIGATIVPLNTASTRVVEKLGFIQEGLLREYILQEDEMLDAYMYSMLKKEWLS